MRKICHPLALFVVSLGVAGLTVRVGAQRGTEDEETAKSLIVMFEGELAGGRTSGAGILVGSAGDRLLIATANHVVRRGSAEATSLTVRLRSRPTAAVTARLLPNADAVLDLALISIEGGAVDAGGLPWRRLGQSADLTRRSGLYHVGFSAGRPWRSNPTPDAFDERMGDYFIFDSNSIGPGDSGGGVFNERWELTGMVQADQQPSESRALRIERIMERLQQWGFATSLRATLFASTRIAVFAVTDDTDGAIQAIRIDGTNATSVANDIGEAVFTPELSPAPQWSPSGDRIAFVKGPQSQQDVYVVRRDGGSVVNVSNDTAMNSSPSWSPDGTRIVFVANSSTPDNFSADSSELWVASVDGRSKTRLTKNSSIEDQPAWSPTDDAIAFVTNRDGNGEIYVTNAAGSNQVNLTRSAAFESMPTWSPDGKRIAFLSSDPEITVYDDIYVMNANGTGRTRLTRLRSEFRSFAWSPDGKRIAFSAAPVGRNSTYEIYVIDLNNSPMVSTGDAGWGPSWSPDSERLVFWTYDKDDDGDASTQVFVADLKSGKSTRITSAKSGHYVWPAWSPFLRE
jgi:Tol biopolymer transport system component